MFWQKPLILLGLLAAFGNTAPLAPLEGDFEDVENVTSHHFEKRINAGVRYVWRTDGRSPGQIKAARGFQTKGKTNGFMEDLSLFRHCQGAKSGASMDNDGFVSTTWKYSVAQDWIGKFFQGKTAYIYKIATDEGLIDVEATLKHYSPYPHELEFAAIDTIPWAQIQGWHKFTPSAHGGSYEHPYEYSKEFNQKLCKLLFRALHRRQQLTQSRR